MKTNEAIARVLECAAALPAPHEGGMGLRTPEADYRAAVCDLLAALNPPDSTSRCLVRDGVIVRPCIGLEDITIRQRSKAIELRVDVEGFGAPAHASYILIARKFITYYCPACGQRVGDSSHLRRDVESVISCTWARHELRRLLREGSA